MRPSNFQHIRIAQFASLIPVFKDLVYSITNLELCKNTSNLLKPNVLDFGKTTIILIKKQAKQIQILAKLPKYHQHKYFNPICIFLF